MTVSITIDGVDVTDDVLFSETFFEMRTNGESGEATMRLRGDHAIADGADWLVEVDGNAVWRGYVLQVTRTYMFDAQNVDEPGFLELLLLRGADLNVLFNRRVVFKGSSPTTVEGTQFPAGTADTTAITELLDHWLDLSDDDLDTTTGVVHVGDLDPSEKTRAWSGSWTWGQAMASIAMLPAAVYYIRPENSSVRGTLVYCDVDVPDAPFGLSDQPNGTTTRGYREMEISLDGTSLANDVLAWGMGYGSMQPVFKRDQSSASQSAHGLWQTASVNYGVYKQGTINRIADSILNGSPQSKRGAKDDRPYVKLTTYEPGLLAGHKVDFASEVWGWTDVIPIRRSTLTFDAPDVPKWELILSHEIDAPWSYIDAFWPMLPGLPTTPCITPPCGPQPPGNPQADETCDCGVTDSFTRTVTEVVHSSTGGVTYAPMGTADCEIAYSNLVSGVNPGFALSGGGVGLSVNGSALVARTFGTSSNLPPGDANGFLRAYALTDYAATKSFTFVMSVLPGSTASSPQTILQIGIPGAPPSGTLSPNVWINSQSAGHYAQSHIGFSPTGLTTNGTLIPDSWWVAGQAYTVTLRDDGADTTIAITDGTTTYAYTKTGLTSPYFEDPRVDVVRDSFGGWTVNETVSVTIDDLVIPEITRCTTYAFDTFRRTVTNGWGSSTPTGLLWTVDTGVVNSWNVSPSLGGYNDWPTSSSAEYDVYVDDIPWADVPAWLLRARFQFDFLPTNPAGAFNPALSISFRKGLSVSPAFATVQISPNAGPPSSGVPKSQIVVTDASPVFIDPSYWAVDTWYNFEIYHDSSGGVAQARIWADGEATPDWMVSGNPISMTSRLVLGMGFTDGLLASTERVRFQSISVTYPGSPCYYDGATPVNPVVTTPAGPSGFGCEEPTRVSSTVYRTSAPYARTSTFVWRDGLLQERGVDYTEDSGNQTVTFSDAVGGSTVIRVCYFAEVRNA